ncbi:MAG: energy transducer TonB [Candidatus Marinimicrobia bacterium]|nr:energy transducer TonB [Candidatus Neomarinimicrobiota bacterium]
MLLRDENSVAIKFKYPLIIRVSTFVGVAVITLAFLVFPRFIHKQVLVQEYVHDVEIEQIEQTQQIDRPPPPARPSVPIASESEDIAEDVVMEDFEFDDFEAWDAPPPPPEGPRVKFIPYDDPPEPIGGYAAIQRNVQYPEIAQEAGIEGTVIVQAFINKSGKVTDAVILKGIPNTGLDEAAMDAIRKTRFRPAKQRDRAVGVWISIPVNFKLRN